MNIGRSEALGATSRGDVRNVAAPMRFIGRGNYGLQAADNIKVNAMLKKTFAPLLAATALALSVPALAGGSEDRARIAISEAKAKIETAQTLGVETSMPREAADAKASLALAEEHFKADRNDQSIQAAIRAESIADAAIGQLQQKDKQAVVDSNAHANAAADQAAAANSRAASAERSAAISAAEAQEAREVVANPQVQTTVTTKPSSRSTTTTTVRKTQPTTTGQVTTTTTVKEPGR